MVTERFQTPEINKWLDGPIKWALLTVLLGRIIKRPIKSVELNTRPIKNSIIFPLTAPHYGDIMEVRDDTDLENYKPYLTVLLNDTEDKGGNGQ